MHSLMLKKTEKIPVMTGTRIIIQRKMELLLKAVYYYTENWIIIQQQHVKDPSDLPRSFRPRKVTFSYRPCKVSIRYRCPSDTWTIVQSKKSFRLVKYPSDTKRSFRPIYLSFRHCKLPSDTPSNLQLQVKSPSDSCKGILQIPNVSFRHTTILKIV